MDFQQTYWSVHIATSLCLVCVAFYGIRQVRQSVIGGHVTLVTRTRGEWIAIADTMISYPQLVVTYANQYSKPILEKLSLDELREYAFANRLCELIAYHYCLEKEDALRVHLKKMYPEGIVITSQRLYEIWECWKLKEDYPREIQEHITNRVFNDNAKALLRTNDQ